MKKVNYNKVSRLNKEKKLANLLLEGLVSQHAVMTGDKWQRLRNKTVVRISIKNELSK